MLIYLLDGLAYWMSEDKEVGELRRGGVRRGD